MWLRFLPPPLPPQPTSSSQHPFPPRRLRLRHKRPACHPRLPLQKTSASTMDFRLRPRLARGAVPLRPCVRSIRTRTAHGLALAALVCITTNAKAADPTPADREKARNLMDEGHALREQ